MFKKFIDNGGYIYYTIECPISYCMITDCCTSEVKMESNDYENDNLIAFREALMEFDAVYARFAKKCGLSETEYWSLLFISEGIVTQSEISEKLSLSRQTLNSAFKQLVKKGLVRLETLENNQRVKNAILTTEGQNFVNTNIVRMQKLEEKAWKSMAKEDRSALIRLICRYSSLIEASLGAGMK